MVINPKNVSVTPRALTYLDKKVLPGPLSGIGQMRLVTLMLYTLGCEYTNLHGQRIIDNEAHYAWGEWSRTGWGTPLLSS